MGNVVYYQLKIVCPGNNCSNKNTVVERWDHHNCGGTMEIGDNAHLRCKRCYHHAHIKDWQFACSVHAGDFQAWNDQSFALAISNSLAAIQTVTDHAWVAKMIKNALA